MLDIALEIRKIPEVSHHLAEFMNVLIHKKNTNESHVKQYEELIVVIVWRYSKTERHSSHHAS